MVLRKREVRAAGNEDPSALTDAVRAPHLHGRNDAEVAATLRDLDLVPRVDDIRRRVAHVGGDAAVAVGVARDVGRRVARVDRAAVGRGLGTAAADQEPNDKELPHAARLAARLRPFKLRGVTRLSAARRGRASRGTRRSIVGLFTWKRRRLLLGQRRRTPRRLLGRFRRLFAWKRWRTLARRWRSLLEPLELDLHRLARGWLRHEPRSLDLDGLPGQGRGTRGSFRRPFRHAHTWTVAGPRVGYVLDSQSSFTVRRHRRAARDMTTKMHGGTRARLRARA